MGVCSFLFRKMAKRGFTLIEALIATVLVGTCIMPIVGTMQNAESMTQRMVNDNKLQMLARSRMNLETSRANNEQKYIDETTGWLYEWYENDGDKFPQSVATYSAPNEFYSGDDDIKLKNMFRVYRIAVTVKDNVVLKNEDGSDGESGLKGLKQVVITSQIVGEDGQFYILEDNSLTDNNYPTTGTEKYKVDKKYLAEMGSISLTPPPDYVQQYSLVSLVTVPEVSSEYVYALDIKNNAVCSFDPVTGMMGKKYKLPGDKLYQAVFPSPDGKKLFLFGGTDSSVGNIGLFDIDPSSATYSQFIGEKGSISRTGNSSSLNRENALYKTKFALRPDGNRAYAIQLQTSGSGYVIKGYCNNDLNGNWNIAGVADWIPASEHFGISYDTATLFLTAGSDGFLYLGPFNDNSIKRHPMYNNTPFNLDFVETAKLPSSVPSVTDSPNMRPVAVCVSPDSYVVYALYKLSDNKKYYIAVFDSLTFQFKRIVNILNSSNPVLITDMNISADGRFVTFVCVNNNAKRMVYILKTSLIESGSTINLENYKAEFDDTIACYNDEYAIYSKLTGHFIVDNADKPILRSIDYNDILKNSPISGSTATVTHSIAQADSSSIITHHSVRTPEIIYTTSKDNNDKFTLKAIDTGLKKFNEEFEIELENNPTSVALSPNGDIISEYAGDYKRYDYDTFLCEKNYFTDFNNFYNLNKFLSEKFNDGSYARIYYKKDGNKFRFDKNPSVELNSNWHIKKVIGTNSGGAIVLANYNDDASKIKSLVDWYELKADKTGFERCGRWVSEGSDLTHFPPYNAIDMAISRDDRVLVFLSEAEAGAQKLYYANFFDFGTYNFGNKTQMKGMIVDFRDEDSNLNLTSANPANGRVEAYDGTDRIATGSSLLDYFTNSYYEVVGTGITTNLKKNPISFDEKSIYTPTELYDTQIISGKNKRIFGYYNKISDNDGSISKVTIASFTPNIKNSLGRAWINNNLYYDNNLIASLTSYTEPNPCTGSNTYLIQLDQTASSKIRTDKFCADYDSDGFLKNNGWKKFDASTNDQNIELCSDLQELGDYIDGTINSYGPLLENFAEMDLNFVTKSSAIQTALCKHIFGRIGTASPYHPRPGMYFNFYKYIPNGPMDISLLFCEGTYPNSGSAGDHRRVFSVYAEEQCFAGLNNFRPSREASGSDSTSGKGIPIVRSGKVRVKDNRIDIRFTDIENNPQDTACVSAIKLKYYDMVSDDTDKYGFYKNDDTCYGKDLLACCTPSRVVTHKIGIGDVQAISENQITGIPDLSITKEWLTCPLVLDGGGNSMTFDISWKSSMDSATATVYFMEHMKNNNSPNKRRLIVTTPNNASINYDIDLYKESGKNLGHIVYKKLNIFKRANLQIKFEKHSASEDVPTILGIKIDWYKSSGEYNTLASASIKLKQNPSDYLDILATETMPLKFEPFWIGEATNIQRNYGSDIVNFEAGRFVDGNDQDYYLCSSSSSGSLIKKFKLNDTSEIDQNQISINSYIQNMILSENKPCLYFNYLDNKINNIFAISDSLQSGGHKRIATDTDNTADNVLLLNKPYNRMKKKSSNISSAGNLASDRYGCNKAVAINGAIYLIGGDFSAPMSTPAEDEKFKKIYKFDPHLNNITQVVTFSNPIKNASAVAYDNTIYVFNGSLDVDRLESNVCAYDVKNNKKIEYTAGGTTELESEEILIFPSKNVTCTVDRCCQSSTPSGGPISNIYDDKDNTCWISSLLRSHSDHNVTFDFGSNQYRITKIETVSNAVTLVGERIDEYKLYGGTSDNHIATIKPDNSTYTEKNISNANYYSYYKMKIDCDAVERKILNTIRLYGHKKTKIPTPSTLGMSPITDDTLTKITANHGGVCMTPYGILRAGGEGTGSSTSQIYWPHAMADYDGDRKIASATRGLSHSLADLPYSFTDFSIVYHTKTDKVYGMGKTTDSPEKVLSYDFKRNEWNDITSDVPDEALRCKVAMIAFGDEIFLFGGEKGSIIGNKDNTIVAWNPETKVVRNCGKIGNKEESGVPLSHISACAYGSDIYLFGGLDKDGKPTKKIYKFTP